MAHLGLKWGPDTRNTTKYRIKGTQISILELLPGYWKSPNKSNNSTSYRLIKLWFSTPQDKKPKLTGSSIREANMKRKSIPEPTALA
jgi:hypothetical protein